MGWSGREVLEGGDICILKLIHFVTQQKLTHLHEAIRLQSKHKRQKEKKLKTVVLEAEGKSFNRKSV